MPSKSLEWIGRAFLAGWIVIMLIVVAYLGLKHSAALPPPSDEVLLTHAMLKLRRSKSQNFLVHVIYSECSCSRALLNHLITRRPFPHQEEVILYVGANSIQREAASRAGFEWATISAADLVSGFALEAAPALAIFDSEGKLRYAGGYYAHPAAIIPLDQKIYDQLASGAVPEPLPVFGCAVSPRLQKALDPLHLAASK